MRETTFLKQNEKKWKEFEAVLRAKRGTVMPDIIAELFVEITDDLAYARTHYPESNTVKYLNGLAGQVHLALVKNKKHKKNEFWAFWKHDLPLIMAQSHTKLLYAFIIFIVAIAIGVVSTIYDENFLRLILSDEYVEMTLKNIRNGDPLAVYGVSQELDMFLSITVNNIRVSFIAFLAGIFFSVGTGYFLAYNGIMVGAFQAFLYQYGYLQESFLTVYIHGTLELSAIVIAGAAGFQLGHSLLFPRTYTRIESLKRGAKKGLMIVLGLVPVFILAGFLEGFVTRHTEMPLPLSLLIIFGSL
ncbi:MAG TPA: stage II sporulation protein M, partial [Bacteroidetes bacterium]|nr:stage II sporulation protein M [Bacteroidota bacterium]